MRVAPIFAVASLVAGCWVEPAPRPTDPRVVPTSRATLTTGRSLVAASGDGAGVFVKYNSGGHWQLAWTCDTSTSHQPCAFDLRVVATGLSNLAVAGTDARLSRNNAPTTGFGLQTTTSVTTDLATFDAAPGASIVVQATINGASYPEYLFFVGACRPTPGGADDCDVATAPSLPIELVPSAP